MNLPFRGVAFSEWHGGEADVLAQKGSGNSLFPDEAREDHVGDRVFCQAQVDAAVGKPIISWAGLVSGTGCKNCELLGLT